jgi:tetratricopeptide (TPR) repeat protein
MSEGESLSPRRAGPAAAGQAAWAGALAAAAIGLLAYLPSLGSGFVNWDDEDYVRDNLFLRAINGRFFEWAFTEFHAANWYPLSWLSHAVDLAVWGLDPFGHHLANLMLHALNCALVVALVRAWLARARPGLAPDNTRAAVIAGIGFALHPVHVEAVSWVSQRKELLCALFYLAGLLLYLRPAATRGARAAGYWGALVCHGLALMAKPMAVSFPLVLALFDLHPLNRWRSPRPAVLALAAKLPFLGLSLGTAVLTVMAQAGGGALAGADDLPLGHRIYTAALALLFYGRDLVWPAGLAPLHPYPDVPEAASLAYVLPVASALAAGAAILMAARRWPGIAVAAAAMLVALLPVLGLVQVGGQARADRYLYLPGVGVFALLGVAAAWGLRRSPRTVLPALTFVAAAWAVLTVAQQAAWRDGASLWTRQIAVYPGFGPGYAYRGHALGQAGAFDAAERDLRQAQRLPPPSPEPAYHLGEIRLRQDRPMDALPLLAAAIEQSQWPDARFHADLGRAYALLGRRDLGLEAVDRALRIEAALPQRRALRACLLAELGRQPEALAEFDRLAAALPGLPPSLEALGRALREAAGAREGTVESLCGERYRAEPL